MITDNQDPPISIVSGRKRRRRLRAVAIVILLCGGGYYWFTQPDGDLAEDQDPIATVAYGDIENLIPASGSLQPKDIVPVGARSSGELVEIYVEVGDYVEEGQIVAKIDAKEQVLRVESSRLGLQNQRNQVAQRELEVENARRDNDRMLALLAAEAVTEQERENAQNRLLSAETSLANLRIQIRQSETNLAQQELQLRYTEIAAPLSGTIISLDQKEGATLNASRTAPTVMQVADLRTLTVETEISEADIQDLKEGVDVYFTTPSTGDRRWYGTLRKIDPMGTAQNNVVMFKGSFDVDNSDNELLPNMTTSVNFVTSSAMNVLTVPLGALTFLDREASGIGRPAWNPGSHRPGNLTPRSQQHNARVELVLPDDSREVRDVVVGLMDDFNAEVISGLEAGDRVVTLFEPADIEEEVDAVTSASW